MPRVPKSGDRTPENNVAVWGQSRCLPTHVQKQKVPQACRAQRALQAGMLATRTLHELVHGNDFAGHTGDRVLNADSFNGCCSSQPNQPQQG